MYQQSQISSNLYLTRYTVTKQNMAVEKPSKVNRFMVIDVSGSMWDELPKMREHLKKNLARFAGPEDTVSIIWFSGKGEYGVLIEGEPVRTLADLAQVNKSIDRWLVPVSLTGFKEPLLEVAKVQKRVVQRTGNPVCSLFFLSDGHDNQWPRKDVLAAAAALSMSSSTIVEYGYYADRTFLAQISETLGGEHVFAESFENYEPIIEAALSGRPSAKRIEIALHDKPIGGFAFSFSDGQLIAYGSADETTVQVPEDVTAIYYLSENRLVLPVAVMEDDIPALYAAVSLFATRMKPEVIWPILRVLGDVKVINQYANCFGKQRYSDFQALTKSAVFDPDLRFADGYDTSKVPADDAFTILDLFALFDSTEDRVLLDHEAFKYNRISRKRMVEEDKLTDEESATLKALVDDALANHSILKAMEAKAYLEQVVASKHAKLWFVPDEMPNGYSIDGLVVAEDRANVSFRVKKTGYVDLSARLYDLMGLVPMNFPTFIYRNYAVIKDGLVNVAVLPMKLSEHTVEQLKKEIKAGRLSPNAFDVMGETVLIHLSRIPIVNLRMTTTASAKELFELEYELVCDQAWAKVYNHFKKELFPKESQSFTLMYGPEASERLRSLGITDYSGFNPKQVQATASDVYIAKELKVSLKGYSSLPSVAEVKKQMEKGKFTATGALMKDWITGYEKFLLDPMYVNSKELFGKTQEQVLESWVNVGCQHANHAVRSTMMKLAKIKFAIIVGGGWFKEWASLDENTLTIDVDGTSVTGTVTQREVEIEI